VIDSNGKPVVDATVTIFVQKTLQPTGRSYLSPGQQARTNSSGVYRLTTLAPGEYYIATTNSKIRFYPSAGEAEQATRVLVRGGEEITGIDVRVPEER
jgi:protocatechuate 3,4-dioxygenase beta subunit